MAVRYRHLRHQGPVIASLGRTALAGLVRKAPSADSAHRQLSAELPPRPTALIRDYVREVGGDPRAYRNIVPAHLFPQWGFPLAARTLVGLPYPMTRVVNGGCRLEITSQLPAGEPLQVTAELADIDDNGRRAILHQVVTTGTASAPDAIRGHLYAIVPLASKTSSASDKRKTAKPRPRVPTDAREISRWRLSGNAGLAFATLTGDINPIHWLRPYAQAFGFRSTILHGFATMARAMEGLNRGVFAGDVRAITEFDVKFTRPLVLPAKVGLYLRGDAVWVGDATSGPAYMTGTFKA